jgi:predicted ferric reductase
MKIKVNWDGLGIFTSIACAIHCLVLPMALTSLPFFGIDIIHDGIFEWSMILLAFFVGVYALVHGYKTHHKKMLPIFVFCVGFSLLVTKQFFLSIEIYFVIPAVFLIIGAHITNYKLCKKNNCTSPHHAH